MSFIERAREMDTARRVLGVRACATPVEIRTAWKQAVFATHPDRNGGSHESFGHVREAYNLLRNEALASEDGEQDASETEEGPRHRYSTVRRPGSIRSKFEPLTDRIVSDCSEALDLCNAIHTDNHQAFVDLSEGFAPDRIGKVTDHVPRMVERQGRSLAFMVSTPVSEGRNRVALPTTLLVDKRKTNPGIFVFANRNVRDGCLLVPDAVITSVFPGAKKVMVRFGAC